MPNHKHYDLTGFNIYIDNTMLKTIGNDCEEKSAKSLWIQID